MATTETGGSCALGTPKLAACEGTPVDLVLDRFMVDFHPGVVNPIGNSGLKEPPFGRVACHVFRAGPKKSTISSPFQPMGAPLWREQTVPQASGFAFSFTIKTSKRRQAPEKRTRLESAFDQWLALENLFYQRFCTPGSL